MSALGSNFYPPSNRRRCVKGRPSYTEPSDNILLSQTVNHDHSSDSYSQNDYSIMDDIEPEDVEEEPITIDLSAFLNENPLLAQSAFESSAENNVASTESSSQFRVTDCEVKPPEVHKAGMTDESCSTSIINNAVVNNIRNENIVTPVVNSIVTPAFDIVKENCVNVEKTFTSVANVVVNPEKSFTNVNDASPEKTFTSIEDVGPEKAFLNVEDVCSEKTFINVEDVSNEKIFTNVNDVPSKDITLNGKKTPVKKFTKAKPLGLSNPLKKYKNFMKSKDLNKTNEKVFGKYPIVKCEKLDIENFMKNNKIKVSNWPYKESPKKNKNFSRNLTSKKLSLSKALKPKLMGSLKPKLVKKTINFNKYLTNSQKRPNSTVGGMLFDSFDPVSKPIVIRTDSWKPEITNSSKPVPSFFKNLMKTPQVSSKCIFGDVLKLNMLNDKTVSYNTYSSAEKETGEKIKGPIITNVNKFCKSTKNYQRIAPKPMISSPDIINIAPSLSKPVVETTEPISGEYTVIEPYVDDPSSPQKPKPILTVPIEVIASPEKQKTIVHSGAIVKAENWEKFDKPFKTVKSVFLNGAIQQISTPVRMTDMPIKRSKTIIKRKLSRKSIFEKVSEVPVKVKDKQSEDSDVLQAKNVVVDAMQSALVQNIKKPKSGILKKEPSTTLISNICSVETSPYSFLLGSSYSSILYDSIIDGFSENEFENSSLSTENVSNASKSIAKFRPFKETTFKINNHREDTVENNKNKRRIKKHKRQIYSSDDSSHASDTLSASECEDERDYEENIEENISFKRKKLVSFSEDVLEAVDSETACKVAKKIENLDSPVNISVSVNPKRVNPDNNKVFDSKHVDSSLSFTNLENILASKSHSNIKKDTLNSSESSKQSEILNSAGTETLTNHTENSSLNKKNSKGNDSPMKQETCTRTLRERKCSSTEVDKFSDSSSKQSPHNRYSHEKTKLGKSSVNSKLKIQKKTPPRSTAKVKIKRKSCKPEDIIREINTITGGRLNMKKGFKKRKGTNSENNVKNSNLSNDSKDDSKSNSPMLFQWNRSRSFSKKKRTLKVCIKRSKKKNGASCLQMPLNSLTDIIENANSAHSVSENNVSLHSSFRDRKGEKMGTPRKEDNLPENSAPVSECNMEIVETDEKCILEEHLSANAQDSMVNTSETLIPDVSSVSSDLNNTVSDSQLDDSLKDVCSLQTTTLSEDFEESKNEETALDNNAAEKSSLLAENNDCISGNSKWEKTLNENSVLVASENCLPEISDLSDENCIDTSDKPDVDVESASSSFVQEYMPETYIASTKEDDEVCEKSTSLDIVDDALAKDDDEASGSMEISDNDIKTKEISDNEIKTKELTEKDSENFPEFGIDISEEKDSITEVNEEDKRENVLEGSNDDITKKGNEFTREFTEEGDSENIPVIDVKDIFEEKYVEDLEEITKKDKMKCMENVETAEKSVLNSVAEKETVVNEILKTDPGKDLNNSQIDLCLNPYDKNEPDVQLSYSEPNVILPKENPVSKEELDCKVKTKKCPKIKISFIKSSGDSSESLNNWFVSESKESNDSVHDREDSQLTASVACSMNEDVRLSADSNSSLDMEESNSIPVMSDTSVTVDKPSYTATNILVPDDKSLTNLNKTKIPIKEIDKKLTDINTSIKDISSEKMDCSISKNNLEKISSTFFYDNPLIDIDDSTVKGLPTEKIDSSFFDDGPLSDISDISCKDTSIEKGSSSFPEKNPLADVDKISPKDMATKKEVSALSDNSAVVKIPPTENIEVEDFPSPFKVKREPEDIEGDIRTPIHVDNLTESTKKQAAKMRPAASSNEKRRRKHHRANRSSNTGKESSDVDQESSNATPQSKGQKVNADKEPTSATPSGRKKNYDPELVTAPFSAGWMREHVIRATGKDYKRQSDIYYFAPDGAKLRSMPDIGVYLSKHPEINLSLKNFTFAKELVFRYPFERERNAKHAGKKMVATPMKKVSLKSPVKLEFPPQENVQKNSITSTSSNSKKQDKILSENSSPSVDSKKNIVLKGRSSLSKEAVFSSNKKNHSSNESRMNSLKQKTMVEFLNKDDEKTERKLTRSSRKIVKRVPFDNSFENKFPKKLKPVVQLNSCEKLKLNFKNLTSESDNGTKSSSKSDSLMVHFPNVTESERLPKEVLDSRAKNISIQSSELVSNSTPSSSTENISDSLPVRTSIKPSATKKRLIVTIGARKSDLTLSSMMSKPCTKFCNFAYVREPSVKCSICKCLFHPECIPFKSTKEKKYACVPCVKTQIGVTKDEPPEIFFPPEFDIGMLYPIIELHIFADPTFDSIFNKFISPVDCSFVQSFEGHNHQPVQTHGVKNVPYPDRTSNLVIRDKYTNNLYECSTKSNEPVQTHAVKNLPYPDHTSSLVIRDKYTNNLYECSTKSNQPVQTYGAKNLPYPDHTSNLVIRDKYTNNLYECSPKSSFYPPMFYEKPGMTSRIVATVVPNQNNLPNNSNVFLANSGSLPAQNFQNSNYISNKIGNKFLLSTVGFQNTFSQRVSYEPKSQLHAKPASNAHNVPQQFKMTPILPKPSQKSELSSNKILLLTSNVNTVPIVPVLSSSSSQVHSVLQPYCGGSELNKVCTAVENKNDSFSAKSVRKSKLDRTSTSSNILEINSSNPLLQHQNDATYESFQFHDIVLNKGQNNVLQNSLSNEDSNECHPKCDKRKSNNLQDCRPAKHHKSTGNENFTEASNSLCDNDKMSNSIHHFMDINKFSQIYECFNLIFKFLSVCDLLRVSLVCRSWKHLATQKFLWENVSFSGMAVKDWAKCCRTLQKFETKYIDFRFIHDQDSITAWESFSEHVNLLGEVEELVFAKVPPFIINKIADTLPQLKKLTCYCLTSVFTEPEIWSTPCEFELSTLRYLGRLEALKISSMGGIILKDEQQSLMPYIPNLAHVVLTGFKFNSYLNLECLSQQKQLITLELGDCIDIEPQIYGLLAKLISLENLCLQNGGDVNDSKLAEAVSKMSKLRSLELMNFQISSHLPDVLKKMDSLQHFSIWPDSRFQAAQVNYNSFSAATSCCNLKSLCWGILVDDDDSVPNALELQDCNRNSSEVKTLSFEELFQALVKHYPGVKVDVKCLPRTIWSEFCSSRNFM